MNSGSWSIRGVVIIDNDNRLCYCRNGNNERKRRGERGKGENSWGWVGGFNKNNVRECLPERPYFLSLGQ